MGPKKKNGVKKFGKDSYLADDRNFESFSVQLAKLGLELRDITGDGNCCFRALSDQLHGNESQHLAYRKQVCQYMRQNKEEFEPFVAALIDEHDENERPSSKASRKVDSFDRYIANLEQPGTYADNGCLVAFARLYRIDINIHQLSLPIWTIRGDPSGKNERQVNLSYHNNEHYSSVRKAGDQTNQAANININVNNFSSMNENESKKSSSAKSKNEKPSKNSKSSASASNSSSKSSKSYTDSRQVFESNNNDPRSDIDNYNGYGNGDAFYEFGDAAVIENGYDIDHDLLDTNYYLNEHDLNHQIEQIIDITNCYDMNLIKTELLKNKNDTEATVSAILSKMPANRSRESSARNGFEENGDDDDVVSGQLSDLKLSKGDRKMEKKKRQMEKQRIKVLEEREKAAMAQQAKQPARKVNPKQVIDVDELQRNHAASRQNDDLDADLMANVEGKFI